MGDLVGTPAAIPQSLEAMRGSGKKKRTGFYAAMQGNLNDNMYFLQKYYDLTKWQLDSRPLAEHLAIPYRTFSRYQNKAKKEIKAVNDKVCTAPTAADLGPYQIIITALDFDGRKLEKDKLATVTGYAQSTNDTKVTHAKKSLEGWMADKKKEEDAKKDGTGGGSGSTVAAIVPTKRKISATGSKVAKKKSKTNATEEPEDDVAEAGDGTADANEGDEADIMAVKIEAEE